MLVANIGFDTPSRLQVAGHIRHSACVSGLLPRFFMTNDMCSFRFPLKPSKAPYGLLSQSES